MTTTPRDVTNFRSARIAGIVLIAATVLEVAVMLHHPSAHGHSPRDLVAAVAHTARLNGFVHGTLIALMLVACACLVEFATWRGWRAPMMRTGLVAYGAGVVMLIGAALVSGFIVPALGPGLPHATPDQLSASVALLALGRAANQALAITGTVAVSVGIGAWSIGLRSGDRLERAIAGVGIVSAAVPVLGLAAGWLRLDVAGMGTVVALQAAWSIAVGAWLVRAGQAMAPRA